MAAVLRVHEVTLEREPDGSEGGFTVNLADGRKLTVFSSGSLSLYVPKDADDKHPEEIGIEWPKAEHLATHCDEETGAFRVEAHHRH